MKFRIFIVLSAALALMVSIGSAQVTETANPAVAISDSSCAGNTDGQGDLTETLTFSQAGTINSVTVSVDIDHTWRGDLQISLLYNAVRSVLVLDADSSGDNLYVTFDDAGAVECGDTSACGTSSSANCTDAANRVTCKAFDGGADVSLNTNYGGMSSTLGAWTLEVCDDAGGDTGILQSWSITLDGPGLPVELMSFTVR